jgi:hypothetical protein
MRNSSKAREQPVRHGGSVVFTPPQRAVVEAHRLQRGFCRLEPGFRIASRQPRPPTEVLQRRRPAALEETPGELAEQRLSRGELLGSADAVLDQRPRGFAVFVRAAAEQPRELGVDEQVREPLLLRRHATGFEHLARASRESAGFCCSAFSSSASLRARVFASRPSC